MYLFWQDKRLDVPVNRSKADIFAAEMLKRLTGTTNYMRLMKLLYFADRYHLRKYIRPIANDDYFAMKKGMVGSYWLDLLRGVLSSGYFVCDRKAVTVSLTKDPAEATASLSESELEALDFALDNFAKYDENQLVDLVHEYPEWSKFRQRFNTGEGKEDVEIRDILNDPTDNPTFKRLGFTDPYKPLTEEEKALVLEGLTEYAADSG